MYIVVCFLLLWVLFQVISINARCPVKNPDPNRLYIMETPNDYHKLRNELFIEILQPRFSIYPPQDSQLHDILDYKLLKNCSPYLEHIIEDAHNLRYMIHLQVNDFYQNNYNDVIAHGYEFADDVAIDDCMFVNREWKCIDNNVFNNNTTEKLVKLVSEPVTTISSLYNMVTTFPTKPVVYRILVCSQSIMDLGSYTTDSYSDTTLIKIRFQSSRHCDDATALKRPLKKKDKNVIAILAPNPNFVSVTFKPVIFYQKPYYVPKDTDLFENGIMRIGSMKTMAKALLQLMKSRYWSRVAVISDDSERSYQFEQELRVLFENEDISYVVMSVFKTNQNYEFSKVLVNLKQNDARIIIANVDEQLAKTLGHQAKDHSLTISHKALWIAPGWSKNATKIAAESMGTVLNLLPSELYDEEQHILNYIDRIIQLINQNNQYREYYDYTDSRNFARDLKDYLNWTNEDIDVYQTKKYKSDKVATFSNDNLKIMKAFYTPADRQETCLLRSPNYYKSCDDMDIIYFMLVIMVFAVSILGITFFFDTNDTPYIRM